MSTETQTEKNETLVVASKVKGYIRDKSAMNTSSAVIEVISNRVKALCDQAMENAKRDGRKTVMDRDFT
jgi:histone H3/H4